MKTWQLLAGVGVLAGVGAAIAGGGDGPVPQRIPTPKPKKPQGSSEPDDEEPDEGLEGQFEEKFSFGKNGGEGSMVLATLEPDSNRNLELVTVETIVPPASNKAFAGKALCRASKRLIVVDGGSMKSDQPLGATEGCPQDTWSIAWGAIVKTPVVPDGLDLKMRVIAETGLYTLDYVGSNLADKVKRRDGNFSAFELTIAVRYRWV